MIIKKSTTIKYACFSRQNAQILHVLLVKKTICQELPIGISFEKRNTQHNNVNKDNKFKNINNQ